MGQQSGILLHLVLAGLWCHQSLFSDRLYPRATREAHEVIHLVSPDNSRSYRHLRAPAEEENVVFTGCYGAQAE